MFESLKIILLSVLAAILYGVVHDNVTARVCVEYFTIGHPPIFRTHSPTLLALGWGVIATWWAGAMLGVLAAIVARAGSLPKLSANDLIRPISVLLAGMAIMSLLAGIAGYGLAQAGSIWLIEPLSSQIPTEKHALFLADGAAHWAAYGTGFLGGLVLCGWIVWRRCRLRSQGQSESDARASSAA